MLLMPKIDAKRMRKLDAKMGVRVKHTPRAYDMESKSRAKPKLDSKAQKEQRQKERIKAFLLAEEYAKSDLPSLEAFRKAAATLNPPIAGDYLRRLYLKWLSTLPPEEYAKHHAATKHGNYGRAKVTRPFKHEAACRCMHEFLNSGKGYTVMVAAAKAGNRHNRNPHTLVTAYRKWKKRNE